MMKTLISLTAVLMLSGCALGAPAAKNLPDATRPTGIHGTVSLSDRDYDGELIAVTDSAFIMLVGKVVSIDRARVLDVHFRPFVRNAVQSLSEEQWQTLRLGSRFPFGIPAHALTELLQRYNQTAVEPVP